MENKKIIFFAPNLDSGGGRVISEVSLNLPNNIQKVIVLFENKINYPYKGELISFNVSLSKNLFFKLLNFLRGLLKFKKILDVEKPDCVISFGNLQNIINILSTKNSIVRVDNPISEGHKKFLEKIYPLLVRILFNRAEKNVVVSKGLARELIKDFKIKEEKIKLIYNSTNIEKIKKLSEEPLELRYQEIFKNPIVINIGNLVEQKGQWHLIRAFKEAKKIKKDLKLVILGEGELEPYLRGLVKNLNLENDVYLLGWQKNPFKFLSKSKLFVLSSLWEGFGIVILEAMACGIPVITSDCKVGPREILAPDTDIDHQTRDIEYTNYGILTPPFDGRFYKSGHPLTRSEKILSEAIIEIFTNKSLSDDLVVKSRQRVEDFNIKKIIKEWNFLNSPC